MSPTVAAVVALVAVGLVYYITTKQEAAAAKRAQSILAAKANQGLSGGDVIAGIAAGAAGYVGGPAAANLTLAVTGRRI